jgi:hypothetical protein
VLAIKNRHLLTELPNALRFRNKRIHETAAKVRIKAIESLIIKFGLVSFARGDAADPSISSHIRQTYAQNKFHVLRAAFAQQTIN